MYIGVKFYFFFKDIYPPFILKLTKFASHIILTQVQYSLQGHDQKKYLL
jgi:hypothetical protein